MAACSLQDPGVSDFGPDGACPLLQHGLRDHYRLSVLQLFCQPQC